MNTVDVVFLLILFLSILLGIARGFIAELLSLIALIINIWVANRFAGSIAPWVADHVALPGLQYALAFVILYGLMWLVTSTITYLCSSLVVALGLVWLDRLLGVIFGWLRGIIIILVIVLVVGLTPIPRETFWQEAMLTASAEHAIEVLRPRLSEALQQHIDFRPAIWIEKKPSKSSAVLQSVEGEEKAAEKHNASHESTEKHPAPKKTVIKKKHKQENEGKEE